jgi:hypothetical protein
MEGKYAEMGRLKLTWLLVLVLCVPVTLWAQEYDVVILNGRVMDPVTMLDAVRRGGAGTNSRAR